jgi:hypothetical protein
MIEKKLKRLDALIRHLIWSGELSFLGTQKNIAKKIGANEVSVSRALKGDKEYLTDNFIERVNNGYESPFNTEWLITGEGERLKNGQNLENVKNSVAIGRDANGSEIHVTSQNVEEFIRITEKYQEHTDKMLAIIEKLINK